MKNIAIIFLLIGSTLAVQAQTILGMRYPLGIPLVPNCGMSLSMGGASVGTPNDHTVLLTNPANLGTITKTSFSSLATLDFTNIINDETKTHTNNAAFLPRQVSFGIPLGIAGTLGMAYDKRTDAKIRFLESKPINLNSLDSSQLGFAQDGGIAVWQVGWGYPIGKWATLGISYERAYYYLHKAQIARVYGYTNTNYVDTADIRFGGNGLKFGVMAPYDDHLTFGCYGEYFFEGTAYEEDTVYSGSSIADTVNLPAHQFKLTLPPKLAIGASYKFTPEWLAAADISATLWDYFHDESQLLSGKLQNAFTFSVGGQYIPAPNLLTPKYWEIIQYRAGFRFTQLPAETASEFAFSIGTGLPLPKGGGLFDLVLEYGRRFDSSYPKLTEEFLHIAFGFNGGRKWAASTQGTY